MNVIFFDGVCNFCNRWVNRLLKWDKRMLFHFSSLQSNYARQTLNKYGISDNRILDGIVLLEGNRLHLKSKAVFRIVLLLGFPYSILSLFRVLPTTFTDAIYDIVAANRYKWFGKSESCSVPEPDVKQRFID